MQSNQDSNDSLGQSISKIGPRMKIALFFKSYTTKAIYAFVIISFVAGTPTRADAGLLDFITGSSEQASASNTGNTEEFGTDNFDANSQNIPLLEARASINPDIKNAGTSSDINIAEEGVLLTDSGPVGSGLESVSSGEMLVYEVKEGDTLSEIAESYDVSVNTIRWENNITGQNIRIGQKLNILPVTGVKHTVKSGDNLDKIANKYEADVEDIMVFNGVTRTSVLKTGDVLYVPNGIKPTTTTTISSSSKPTASYSSGSASSGYYIKPTTGPITSPYGPRKGSYHYGIDIGARVGTTVVASAQGVVVSTLGYCKEGNSSCGGRYGNYIVIEHPNGQRTRYAHLSKISVSVGDTVSQREKIGTTGNTGRTTGPHLHFQIEKSNGSTIRPPSF